MIMSHFYVNWKKRVKREKNFTTFNFLIPSKNDIRMTHENLKKKNEKFFLFIRGEGKWNDGKQNFQAIILWRLQGTVALSSTKWVQHAILLKNCTMSERNFYFIFFCWFMRNEIASIKLSALVAECYII